MGECVGDAATEADSEQWKRVLAALLCMRTKRLSDKRHLDFAIEAQASVTRTHKRRLLGNAFTLAAVMAASSPGITRERWAFERNERWFEDTLPNLSEDRFKQAMRVSPSRFRYLVDLCRCVLERQNTNMREHFTGEANGRGIIPIVFECRRQDRRTPVWDRPINGQCDLPRSLLCSDRET